MTQIFNEVNDGLIFLMNREYQTHPDPLIYYEDWDLSEPRTSGGGGAESSLITYHMSNIEAWPIFLLQTYRSGW